MMTILGIFLSVKKMAGTVLDALPASVKWGLLAVAVLVGSNMYTHYRAVSATEQRVTSKYETMLSGMRRLNAIAVGQQEKEQARITADLKARGADVEDLRRRYNTLKQEIPNYVTKKADAMCTVTTGFERMFDASATGARLEVSGSGGLDVDAPSSVTISQVAEITVANNAECVERGKVIDAWQVWYRKSKSNYERAQAITRSNPSEVPLTK